MPIDWATPAPSGIADSIRSLGDQFTQAAQMQRQREMDAANMLMQRQKMANEERRAQADEQRAHIRDEREMRLEHQQEQQMRGQAVAEIHQHLHNGDEESAQAAAMRYGVTLAPQTPATPPAAPAHLEQSTPPAPNMEGPSPLGQLTAAAAPGAPAPNGDSQTTVAEPGQQDAEHMGLAHHLATADQRYTADAERARQFTVARDAAKGGQVPQEPSPVYELTDAHGRHLASFDMAKIRAQRVEERSRLEHDVQTAYAGGNPNVLQAALAGARLGQGREAIFKTASDIEKQQLGQQGKSLLEQMQEAAGKYRRKGGSGNEGGPGGGGYNLKTEKQNEMELGHIENEGNKFLHGSGLDKTIQAHNEFTKALHELNNSKSPASQIGVLDKFIRGNTGRGAVMQTIRMQLQHMGGLDAQLQGWIEGKETGALGAQQVQNLKLAIQASRDSTREELANQHQAFVDSHFGGSDYNDKGNWEKQHQKIFGQVRDEAGKELFPTQYDPKAPTIVRGSGRRSVDTVGVNAQAGGGAGAPVDQGKVKLARDRLAKNPGDKVAKDWLAAHGL